MRLLNHYIFMPKKYVDPDSEVVPFFHQQIELNYFKRPTVYLKKNRANNGRFRQSATNQ
jgi:hypothetical protein